MRKAMPRVHQTPNSQGGSRTLPCDAAWVLIALLCLTLMACSRMNAYAEPFTAQSPLALLSEKGVLPRNINLKAFEPHRDAGSFSCRMAGDHAPAITAQAQALHEEAMQLTSPALWPKERNWPRAMQLWQQAAQMGHWKAGLMWMQTAYTGQGENSEKGQYRVDEAAPETVIKITEMLMQQGVADAFFWMGEFHHLGHGVKQSTDRAWAFWELAADLGSAKAQTKIASVLGLGTREMEKDKQFSGKWSNPAVEMALLACAHAQGYGEASIELGRLLDILAEVNRLVPPNTTPEAQFRQALQVLHDGVKFGSEDAAGSLGVAFSGGKPLVANTIDKARKQRYNVLGDALFNNPDLRFPNLDKVLPLPPAVLPKWDGKPESLIEAAKGVRVTPLVPDQPEHQTQKTSRAYVPPGHTIAMPAGERAGGPIPGQVLQATGPAIARAPRAGYYQALPVDFEPLEPRFQSILAERERHRNLVQGYPPLRYVSGEPMQFPAFLDPSSHLHVQWQYVGQALATPLPQDHLAHGNVDRAVVRAIDAATSLVCTGDTPCPVTGIWEPVRTQAIHPAAWPDAWKWQSFVEAGQPMPSLAQLGPSIDTAPVHWSLVQATGLGFEV